MTMNSKSFKTAVRRSSSGRSAQSVKRRMRLDDLASPVRKLSAGLEFPISQAAYLLWRMRNDLQARYDLSTQEGRRGFLMWCWLIVGNEAIGEYEPRGVKERFGGEPYRLLDVPAEHWSREGFSRLMLEIWGARPDLRSKFDLELPEGRSGFFLWYLRSGRREINRQHPPPAWQVRTLAELDESLPQDDNLPISILMGHIWRGATDLQRVYPLESKSARGRFIAWFYFVAYYQMQLERFVPPQQLAWLLGGFGATGLRRDALLFWMHTPALQKAIPLGDSAKVAAYRQWFSKNGGTSINKSRPSVTLIETQAPRSAGVFSPPKGFGVNLIGHAYAEMGIGEDIRMASACLDKAGIPHSVFNFMTGPDISQQDKTLAARVAGDLPYSINLFCLTAQETVRAYLVHGKQMFAGRYNIGWWPWELPRWPEDWSAAFALVDEVWASSNFTRNSYAMSAPVPVHLVPLAVSVAAMSSRTRGDFGLPLQPYLFFLSFDFNSTLERKNPWAALAAFSRAFAADDMQVGLVIKTMHVDERNPGWQKLMAVVAEDKRIHVLNQSLRRPDLLALYRACDCFVSLHRSEGFGRGVAEAMLLAKDVIVSDYSGTVDFAKGSAVHPVPGRLISLNAGAYHGASKVQKWFEPSVAAAAAAMRKVAKLGKSAANVSEPCPEAQYFSIERVASVIAGLRLEERC